MGERERLMQLESGTGSDYKYAEFCQEKHDDE